MITPFGFAQAQDLSFQMSNKQSGGGDSIRVDITLENFDSIYSFQYTTRWDTSELVFQGVGNFNMPELDENSFGYVGVDEGFLITLWADLNVNGYDVDDGTVIYSIFFTAPCGDNGVDTAPVEFSNNPIPIMASTLDEEFVPGTEDGAVIFVELDASASTVTDVSCLGGSDGCITVNTAGGTAPFTYAWSNSGTGQELCDLPPGTYTCTVTDAGDCTAVSPAITVGEPAIALNICGSSSTDVNCNAGSDGCIDLTVCGGTPGYTYLWTPGGMTVEDPCGLTAGVYTCEVTDANGCSLTTAGITVAEPASIVLVSFNIVNATCVQGGSIDITLSGGNSPYTYLWSNGAVTEDVSDLLAGFYTCVVTDSDACTFTTPALEVMLENSDLELTGSAIINVSCFNGNDGAIDLEVSGSATPFTYLWSNGDMTEDISGLDADTYNCTITDANGCVFTTPTFEITEPATALVIDDMEVINLNCFGATNGCVTIEVVGGVAPYSYAWSNGETTQEICDLPADDYTCTVTDAGACSMVSFEATVEQPALLEACGISVDDVSCFGAADGCIDLMACGGIPGYTYLWSNSSTEANICGLIAGTYSATITDANGCTASTVAIEIDQPASIVLTNTVVVNATCGQGGSIDITLSGGNNPYTYLWSNGDTTEDIDDLVAGFYTCVVTDSDACVFTTVAIEVVLENSDLNFMNASVGEVQCFGESNGSIDITVAGAATPFSFSWSNGEMIQNIDGLPAGNYSCTITDANGCVVTTPAIEVGGPSAALEVDAADVTDVSCFGENNGSIALTMMGGTSPYLYAWSNGGTTAAIDDLPPGPYTCTVTDTNSCTEETTTFQINQPAAVTLSNSQVVDATCMNDGNSGSISISVGGGNGPYTYLWSNAAVDEDISGLAAGTYICTITDNSMCSFVTQTFVVEEDAGDLALDGLNSTDVNCIGGSDGAIALSVSGTATPFAFVWNNGAMTQNLSNLSPGTYTCTITDGNTCSVVTQTVTIGEPVSGIAVTNIASENASCFDSNDGSVSLNISGGTTPYTYDWSNGDMTEDITGLAPGSYSCVVTDGNGCSITTSTVTITAPDPLLIELVSSTNASCGQGGNNGSVDIEVDGGTPIYAYLWSNGAVTQDISGIPSGTYTCVVTDLEGCTQTSGSYTIENIGSNLMYNGAISGNVNCFNEENGFVDIDVSGTATPLTYLWSNLAITEDISDLSGGTYSCTITNANGCTTVTPVYTITEPNMSLDANTVTVLNTCAGTANGSIGIEGVGGTAPYSFAWSNGGMTATINDLVEGAYTCTITDANGCEFTTSAIDIENIDSDLAVTGEVLGQITCFGFDNGFVDVDVSGSTTPIEFIWSNGDETEDIENLAAGNYTCTISDGNGCVIVTNTFTIAESPDALLVDLVALTDASCGQGASGSIDIEVTGGVSTYTYLWSNGAMTQDLAIIPSGIYNCTVTDMNGCTLVTPNYGVINQGSDLSLNATTEGNVSCFSGSDGFINLEITGTSTPITFNWDTGELTQNLSGLSAGTYSCTITDNAGCTAVTPMIEIMEPEALTSVADQVVNACTGTDNGSISITVSGGTLPYAYLWSNGEMTAFISDLPAGMYSCLVTDGQGCIVETETYEIMNVASDLELSNSSIVPISCFGESDGAINIEPMGTATPFTYLWSNGAVTQDLDNLFAGVYSCLITDANSCVFQTEEFLVEAPDLLDVCAAEVQHPLCNGVADGCIDLTACGGTAPLTYLWSNGSIFANPCGLAEGIYNCTITDANGCETISPAYELESTADPMTMDASSSTDAVCGQGTGGTIDITIGGGLSPYTYIWNNGSTMEDQVDLIAGNYICTVTDNQGCTFVTESFQILNDGSDLSLTAIANTDVICFGEETGAINISVIGSQTPISFAWSNGDMTEDIEELAAGVYTCTVTDNVGCSIVILEVEITEPEEALSINMVITEFPTCFGVDDGFIMLDAVGGTLPYSYLWSDGSMEQNRTGLGAGDFVCTVTDANGCEAVSMILELEGPMELNLINSVIVNEIGGGANGSVSIEVDGGNDPYTYLWDDPAMSTGSTLSAVPAGEYSCVVTDANGCTQTFGVFIVQSTIGINELENPGFEVYPNPFVLQFTIVLEELASDIQLIDVAGRVLYRDVSPGVDLTKQVEVDVPAGIYVLKVQMSDGNVGIRKVVVR